MIQGIGTDILEIARVRQILSRHREKFIERVLTAPEKEYCFTHKDPAPFIAARFAGKEAVAKALGTGFGEDLDFHDIMITHSPLGAPEVKLSQKADLHFGCPAIKLSLSHCKTYVVAFAVAIEKISRFSREISPLSL
jgi:holo-[acyl-carrier protein] synthase